MPRNSLAVLFLLTAMNLVANSLKEWTAGNYAAWLVLFALADVATLAAVAIIRSDR
jgi:hypothetical protein